MRMPANLSIVLLSLLLVTVGVRQCFGLSSEDRATGLVSNVVTITVSDAPITEPSPIGFGFVIGRDKEGNVYIATANHNVRKANGEDGKHTLPLPYIHVGFYDGSDIEATLLDKFLPRPNDLALLRTPPPPSNLEWTVAALGELGPNPRGTEVHPIGVDGTWLVPQQGGLINSACSRDCLVLTEHLPIEPGMSGAPLVSASGIVAMVLSDKKSTTSFALSSKVMREQIENWKYPWQLVTLRAFELMSLEFIEHAKRGDLVGIKDLIYRGVSARTVDVNNHSALYWAVRYQHRDVVEYLVKLGVKDNSALTPAADNNDVAIGETLLNATPSRADICPALEAATAGDHKEFATLLLERPAPGIACDGNKLLWVAANNGYGEMGLLLLKHGVIPHDDEPLGLALSRSGTDALAIALIPLTPVGREKESDWYNALHSAAQNDRLSALQEMIRRGWEKDVIGARGLGATPLGLAVQNRHYDAASFLIKSGADAKLNGSNELSPMASAIRNNDKKMIQLLTREGGWCVGIGVLMEAAERGTKDTHDYLVGLLESGGARKCG